MTLLYVLFALIGIGLIIFIHECGHFFAAKKVGVKVERFALGFDPPFRGRPLRLFSFKRGDTEYILGAIPFGGYVKMAGEMLPEEGKKPEQHELLAKSVGARAFVFAAGAAMNIASAFVFFMIAFTIGVPFIKGTVGNVAPGEAAWEAGIRSGDVILTVNDRPIIDFNELRLASALSSKDDVIRLKIRRDSTDPFEVQVKPRMDPEMGMRRIGLGPAWSPVLQQDPPEGSPAALAGLAKGDRIIGARLGGETLPPLPGSLLLDLFTQERQSFPSRPVELEISGERGERWVELEPRADPDADPLPRIQLRVSGGTIVEGIAPGSSARKFLGLRDRVVKVNGEVVHSMHWLIFLGKHTTDERLRIEVESAPGKTRTVEPKRQEFFHWLLHDEIHWTGFNARIASLANDSPLSGLDLREGDVLATVGSDRVDTSEDADKLLKAARNMVALEVLRGGSWTTLSYTPPVTPRAPGVEWTDFPPIGSIVPGGPADKAGITPGSVVTRLGDTRIRNFQEFRTQVGETKPSESLAVEWIDELGEKRTGQLSVGIKSHFLGLDETIDLEMETFQVGPMESFELGIHRTISVVKQVFLTLRSLARRDVSAKNLSGPIGITHVFTHAARSGLARLIYLLAIVSVNLGIVNLLPLPILDGGHLTFLCIEKIKGSPVGARVQEIAATAAFFLIIALFIFITIFDIKRLIG